MSKTTTAMDALMPELLGVPKAVLEHVVFCHQEESNWPLMEGAKLKERFDQIFESARWAKALEDIRKLRKERGAGLKDAEGALALAESSLGQLKALKAREAANVGALEEVERGKRGAEDRLARARGTLEALRGAVAAVGERRRELDAVRGRAAGATRAFAANCAEVERLPPGEAATIRKLIAGGAAEFEARTAETERAAGKLEAALAEKEARAGKLRGALAAGAKALAAVSERAAGALATRRQAEDAGREWRKAAVALIEALRGAAEGEGGGGGGGGVGELESALVAADPAGFGERGYRRGGPPARVLAELPWSGETFSADAAGTLLARALATLRGLREGAGAVEAEGRRRVEAAEGALAAAQAAAAEARAEADGAERDAKKADADAAAAAKEEDALRASAGKVTAERTL